MRQIDTIPYHLGSVQLRSGEWDATRVVIRDGASGRIVQQSIYLINNAGETLRVRPPREKFEAEYSSEELRELAESYATERDFPSDAGETWTAIAAGNGRFIVVDPNKRHGTASSDAGFPLAELTLEELRGLARQASP